ncbi:MAG TPA: O-antigen ligase family protein [Phototrophicaceae bacterium]|nr:O-antigen ligase family protein [Phototrophicaceae bacterium]
MPIIATRLKRYLFIFIAAYFVLFGGTYYYEIFAVRVFQHIFTTVVLAIWLILRLIKRRGLPLTPLNRLLYLGVIAWFISAIFSLDPRMALENLWFPITNLLFFFVMVDLLQSGQEGLLTETQFLLGALVVILAGVQLGSYLFGWGFGTPTIGWVSVLGPDLRFPLVAPRLYVPIGVSTWLAAYVTPIIILAAAWGWAARRRAGRNALWVLALLLVIIMLLTGSRGGLVSFGAGAAALLVLEGLRSERVRQLARRYAIPLLIVVVVIAAAGTLVLIRVSADPGHSSGDVLRFDLWRGALGITREYPFLGVGPGLFGRAYRLIRDPTYVDNRLGTAHNFYLNSLAENGIIGALIALALGVILLRIWWKQWRSADTPSRAIHLEGAFAALIGFGVQSFFDTFTGMPLVLLALGLIAYCVTSTRSKLDPPLKGSLLAGAASLVIVLGFGVGLLRSDQAQAAFINGVKGDPAQAEQAVALDPSLHLYTLEVAYSTALTGDTAQAISQYQQALTLEPTWDTGWINLAALLQRQGNTTQALDALQKAINIDNRNGALLMWARLAEQTNAAPSDTITATYLRYLHTLGYDPGALPLSSFWTQTDLRKQAVTTYIQQIAPDFRYRVAAELHLGDLASLVPQHPTRAADWWVVGQYALTVEHDPAQAESAFSNAIRLSTDGYTGDYYVSRARARVSSDPHGAARDLQIADLLGTYDESPNAVRAQLASSEDEQRRLLANAVPPQVIDQNFEGVLFAGRVASFDLLPEMKLPGPGHSVLQPWYDLAANYAAAGQTEQAANVYNAILERAPEETEARALLAGSASS